MVCWNGALQHFLDPRPIKDLLFWCVEMYPWNFSWIQYTSMMGWTSNFVLFYFFNWLENWWFFLSFFNSLNFLIACNSFLESSCQWLYNSVFESSFGEKLHKLCLNKMFTNYTLALLRSIYALALNTKAKYPNELGTMLNLVRIKVVFETYFLNKLKDNFVKVGLFEVCCTKLFFVCAFYKGVMMFINSFY